MNWDYGQPVRIVFGNGRLSELNGIIEEMGVKNGILIAGPSFFKNGTAERIIEDSKGLLTASFGEISPNPGVTQVDACAQIIRQRSIGFIVALGGGSTIDLAKAAGTISQTDDSIRKYHATGLQLPDKRLPLIAIPTTAGTGTEVTCVAVLSDHANGKKAPINSDTFFPDIALIDPELTYSMPKKITASTGIDVLSHALEGYWSKGHQPICDACAVYAADLVFHFLARAYNNPEDRKAREKMCEASLIAGLAFTLPKTTSSHACSFPLTNLYHIPHGEACGLTLDYFCRINGKDAHDDGRMQELASKLGFSNTDALADEIKKLKIQLALRCDLKDLSLSDEQIEELVKTSHHPNMLNNPVEITDDILEKMYCSFC